MSEQYTTPERENPDDERAFDVSSCRSFSTYNKTFTDLIDF